MKHMAKVDIAMVAYRGGAPVINDLLGGHIPISFNNAPEALGQIKGGAVRALAVTTATRSAFLPDVPTMAEAGLPGYDCGVWWALMGPAGMPADVVAKIARDTTAALQTQAFKDRLTTVGATPRGSSPKGARCPEPRRVRQMGPHHQERRHQGRMRRARVRAGVAVYSRLPEPALEAARCDDHRCRCNAAMPSRRPVKPRPSVVVALTPTRPSSRSSSSAMRRRMASRCGAILGASHSSVTSTLPIVPPRARTSRKASRRKMADAAPFQRGSVSGKCWPMSPVADGAEQRVRQGVQGHVGVGVALQRMRVGNADAAQPDVVAGHEPVHVEALSRTHVGIGAAARSAMARSSAVVSLRLDGLPMTSATGRPAHSATAASSVMSSLPAAWARFVRGQDLRETEPLRGLRPPQAGTVERGGDAVVRPRLLERVGHGNGGDGAG